MSRGERKVLSSFVISIMIAWKLLRHGCVAYLTYIIDPINEEMELTKILILKGCPDLFPRELPRLPPDSEVEVSIDVIPRTISIGVDAFTNESHKTKSFDDID